MIGTVVENRLDAYHRIARHRPLLHGFLKSLFHRRIIVLGNGAPYYLLLEHIGLLQILGRAEPHFHMSVLAVPAGLLFVFVFHIRLLPDGLPICNLGTIQLHLYLVLIQKPAYHDLQMLITHTVEQCLSVLGIVDNLQCQILMGHFLQCLRNLIHIPLVLGLIAHICIRCGDLRLTELDGRCLGGQAVSGSGSGKLGQSADIARMKLRNLNGLVALHHVELTHLLLNIPVHIIDEIICLQHA